MRRSGAGRREDRQGAVWGWAGARKRGEGSSDYQGVFFLFASQTLHNRKITKKKNPAISFSS